MKHSLSAAAVALAVGFGLASVGVQAHGMQHQQSMSMQQHHQAARHASRMTKQVQQKLKAEGFYHGRIDGVVGSGTRHAIAEFQRQNNLRPTARLDRNTLNRMMGNRAVGVGSTAPHQQPNRNFTSSSGSSTNHQMSGPTGTTAPNPPPAAPTTEPSAPGANSNMPAQGAGGNR